VRMPMASLIFLFFIRSPTSLTFLGEIRIILVFAVISIHLFLSLNHFCFSVSRMAVERPGRREFSKLVAYHFLAYANRDKFLTVVHSKGQTYKIGNDG